MKFYTVVYSYCLMIRILRSPSSLFVFFFFNLLLHRVFEFSIACNFVILKIILYIFNQ